MDGSRKGLTSNAHLDLAVRVEHRTYGLNLQAGTPKQSGTARHPSDLPNGPASRAGRCDAMRRNPARRLDVLLGNRFHTGVRFRSIVPQPPSCVAQIKIEEKERCGGSE